MKKKNLSISTFMVLCIMVFAPIVAQAQILAVPPTGDLTGRWWQWAVSMPSSQSAITDTTGALCGLNQQGGVWFLAGTTGGSVTRSCSIPAGKAILFPIITAEWSVAEANAFADLSGGTTCFVSGIINGIDQKALRACANAQIDHVTYKETDIDGVNVQNLDNYRVQSPIFSFNADPNNPFGIPGGITKSVSDGYWILIPTLSKGQHSIHFHGKAEFQDVVPPYTPFTFDTEATYNINIV
jgi:hypothetical protein